VGNYSFKTTNLPEPVNGVVEGHNFTQGNPHTAIYAGQTGLTFRNCNLMNCDVPAGSVVENSLYPIHVSFCSHVRPEWLENNYISACGTDCIHKTVTDTMTIDGVAIDTHITYEDKAVS
jgi:hypothetical protein